MFGRRVLRNSCGTITGASDGRQNLAVRLALIVISVFAQFTLIEESKAADRTERASSRRQAQLGVVGTVLLHPERCLAEPVLGSLLIAELGVSHGEKEVIEGGTALG